MIRYCCGNTYRLLTCHLNNKNTHIGKYTVCCNDGHAPVIVILPSISSCSSVRQLSIVAASFHHNKHNMVAQNETNMHILDANSSTKYYAHDNCNIIDDI